MQDDDERSVSGSHRRGRSRSPDAESPESGRPHAKRHQREAPDGAEARLLALHETQMREMAAALEEARQRAAELEASERNARQRAAELEGKAAELEASERDARRKVAELELLQNTTKRVRKAAAVKPRAKAPCAPSDFVAHRRTHASAPSPPALLDSGAITNAATIVDTEFAAVEAACHAAFEKRFQFGKNRESLAEFSAFCPQKLRDPELVTRKNVVLCAPARANKSPAIVIAGIRKLVKERPIVIFLTGVSTNTVYGDAKATITNYLSLIGALDMFYSADDVKLGTLRTPTKRDEVIAKMKDGRPVLVQLRFDIHHLRPMVELLSTVFDGDVDVMSDKVTFVFDEPQAKITSRGREPQRQKLLYKIGFRKAHVVYVSATVADVRDINFQARDPETGAPKVIEYDKEKLARRNFYNCLDQALFVELPSLADGRPLYGVNNCYGTLMSVDDSDAEDKDMVVHDDDETMGTPADKEWREVDDTMRKILQRRVFQDGAITAFFGITRVEAKNGITPFANRLLTLSMHEHNGYVPVDMLVITHHRQGAVYFGENGKRGTVFKTKNNKGRKASVPDAIALAWIDGQLTPETAIVILSNAAYQGSCDYQINRSYKNMSTRINVPAHTSKRVITTLSAEVMLARHENSIDAYRHVFDMKLRKPIAGFQVAVYDADAAGTSASGAAKKDIGGLGKYVFLDMVVRTDPRKEFVLMAAESDTAKADMNDLRMMEVVAEKRWSSNDAVVLGTMSVPDALLDNMILFASKSTDSGSISQGAGRANTTDRSVDTPLMLFATERDIRTVQALPSAQMKLLRLAVDDLDAALDVTESENLVINQRRRGHSRLKTQPVKVNVSPHDDYRTEKTGGDAEEDGDGDCVVGDGVAEKDWTDHEILIKILSAIDLSKERREEGKKRSSSEVVFKKGEIVAAGIVAERDTSRLNDLVRRQFLKEVVPDEEYVVSTKEYKQKMRDIFAVLDVETRTVERSVMYEKGILNEKKVEDYKEMGLIEEVEDGAKIRPTVKAYRTFMNGDTLLIWFAKTRTEFRGTSEQLYAAINAAFPVESSLLIAARTRDKRVNAKSYIHFGGFSKTLFDVADDTVMQTNGAKTKNVYCLKDRAAIRSILEGSP